REGTAFVKSIPPDPGGIFRSFSLTTAGATLFFSAANGAGNRALWKSDGTEAGTIMVKDVTPDHLTSADGILFFTAGEIGQESVWRSDGTEAGTLPITDIGPHVSAFTAVKETLF